MSEFKHTIQAIDEFGRLIVDNYKAELEACGYQDGQLYRTLSYSVSTGTGGWVISVSLENYWKYIESGRRAGAKFPPLDAIEKWIVRKQIIPHSMTLKSGKTVIPSVKQLSFLIARKISRDGIRPRPLFKQSFESAKREFLHIIEEAVLADIKESLI